MSLVLRIALIASALFLVLLVLRGIKKSSMRIEDSVSWIIISFLVLLLSLFPGIALAFANAFEIQSPVNFVYIVFIGVLLAKCFSLSQQISQIEIKMKELIQEISVDKLDHYERVSNKKE